MFKIKEYRPSHRKLVKEIAKKREITHLLEKKLPKLGVLVFSRGILIAAGFIRRVEGNAGMFDGFITNPDFPPDIRDAALHSLTIGLLEMADTANIRHIIAITIEDNIVARAQKHGFRLVDYKLLTKTI